MVKRKKIIVFLSIFAAAVLFLLSSCTQTRTSENTIFPLDANGQTNRNVVLINNTEYSLTPRKDANGKDLDDSATVSDSIDVKTDGETLTVVLPQVSPVMTWRAETDADIVKQEEKNAIGNREPLEGESGNVQIFTVKKPADGKTLRFKFVNVDDVEKPFDKVIAVREITISVK